MRKINLYFLTFIFLFFTNPTFSIEQEIKDIVDTIDAAKKDFNNVDTSEVIEAVKMDKAFEQIDKVTEFVKEALQDGNEDSAIKALEFIEKSLAGTNALVPQEFSSDMSKADLESFGEDKMAIVNEITTDMKVTKEEKLNDLVSGMVDISEEGIDSFGIVETLDKIGIETIDVAIAISKKKEMATWTKEEWAESWNGDILTDDGKQIISDDEINSNISSLEKKLQDNNASISIKKSSLTELQLQADPMNLEMAALSDKKTQLLAKFNEEIIKQNSNILTDEEISASKKVSEELNTELSSLVSKISTIENKSIELNNKINNLNIELSNEVTASSNLSSKINSLNKELQNKQNLISKRQLELDQLKKEAPNLDKNIEKLNDQLEKVSLQKDFIEADFEKSIDNEVEALKYYGRSLGDSEEEMKMSMRELDVIIDDDPRKARAFEIEKWGSIAGLSKTEIDQGIQAVNTDDWDTQKDSYKKILKGMAKNPEWSVDMPSDAELNVIIEEDKTIQEVALLAIEGQEIKSKIDKIINEKISPLKELASLNTHTLRYASTWEGMPEHKYIANEFGKVVVSSPELSALKTELDSKQLELNELKSTIEEQAKEFEVAGQGIQNEMNDIVNLMNTTTINKNRFLNKIGGTAYVYRNRGDPNWSKNIKELRGFDQEIGSLRSELTTKQTDYYNVTYNNNPRYQYNPKLAGLQQEVSSLSSEYVSAGMKIEKQVRENLVLKVEDAKKQIEEITNSEIAKVDGYNYQEKILKIVEKIPSFDESKINNLNEVLYNDIAWSHGALVGDALIKNRGAAVRAALTSQNELDAFLAATVAMSQIGEAPVSEYMTGPYWEMSNVKAAAIVRAKKYDWVDDYNTINAWYEGPVDLTTAEIEEAETELSNILGKNNPKLDALKTKIAKLKTDLQSTKEKSLTVNDNLDKLDIELDTLKTNEKEINSQIDNLTKEFTSKENLIANNKKSLSELESQLNPISEEMNSLNSQKAELNAKLDKQLNKVSEQIKSQSEAATQTDALKANFNSQISELDQKLNDYEKQSIAINDSMSKLATELESLETETPEISGQIAKLNNELKNVIEIKADLAMTQAIKSGINVNEKIVATIAKLENKSIVQIEGTNLMRVVDTDTLTNEAGNFEAPVGTFTKGNQVYLAGAATREQILSVGKIDETGDLNIQLSQVAAEKINSGMFGLETAKGMVATDDMGKGVYTLIDPKTGRQVIDSHTGNALYGGIICDGEQCGPSSNLGRQVASEGYVFVKQGDMDQGTMCTGGDCSFNISQEELETFNKQVEAGIDPSAYGYNDALAAATINTKGLVADSVSEAAGEVTKEFFSGKFNVMTDVGGQEALVQKARDTVARLQAAKAAGEKISESAMQIAQNQVAAEQSVLDAVNAAKAAATTEVASVAASAAAEAAQTAAQATTEVAQAAAQEVAEEIRAAQNVNQIVRNADGSYSSIVGKTGVNVSHGQTVVWSGLTSASATSAQKAKDGQRAIDEAAAASGLDLSGVHNPAAGNSGCQGQGGSGC